MPVRVPSSGIQGSFSSLTVQHIFRETCIRNTLIVSSGVVPGRYRGIPYPGLPRRHYSGDEGKAGMKTCSPIFLVCLKSYFTISQSTGASQNRECNNLLTY